MEPQRVKHYCTTKVSLSSIYRSWNGGSVTRHDFPRSGGSEAGILIPKLVPPLRCQHEWTSMGSISRAPSLFLWLPAHS